jgi:hypothetical protein
MNVNSLENGGWEFAVFSGLAKGCFYNIFAGKYRFFRYKREKQ